MISRSSLLERYPKIPHINELKLAEPSISSIKSIGSPRFAYHILLCVVLILVGVKSLLFSGAGSKPQISMSVMYKCGLDFFQIYG